MNNKDLSTANSPLQMYLILAGKVVRIMKVVSAVRSKLKSKFSGRTLVFRPKTEVVHGFEAFVWFGHVFSLTGEPTRYLDQPIYSPTTTTSYRSIYRFYFCSNEDNQEKCTGLKTRLNNKYKKNIRI